ncbi:hypothetical protein BBJ28_00011407 [Nothophytophthora sp. Chile5]|nr:hypothetical protein BBJ28_00011407 [Nothophytophthora sp. Chile5]
MNGATASSSSSLRIAAVCAKANHVFLPRRLPDQDDAEARSGLLRGAFVNDVYATAASLDGGTYGVVTAMLETWAELQGATGDASLLARKLEAATSGDIVPFLVFEQNALLLIEKCAGEFFLVHACEVLPRNAQAFAGASVEWPVPQVVFRVPRERLLETQVLMKLNDMANKAFSDCMASTWKKGVQNDETREPPFPRRLFGWLLPVISDGIIDVTCDKTNTKVKKLRHQVSYGNAKLPWIRSMEWNAVKAACHWVFHRSGGDTTYKCLILRYMTELLSQGFQRDLLDNDLAHNMKAKIARRANKLLHDSPCSYEAQDVSRACLACVSKVKTQHDRMWVGINSRLHSEQLIVDETMLCCVEDTSHDVKAIRQFCECESSVAYSTDWKPPMKTAPSTSDTFLQELRAAPNAQTECQALIDVENWIVSPVSAARALPMVSILELMKCYCEKAGKRYAKDPEGFSRMIISLYLLAVFADRAIVRSFPLVRSHRFPLDTSLLSDALAPSRRMMKIAHEIEEYVTERNKHALSPSLVSGDTSKECFAYRYAMSNGFDSVIEEIQNSAQRLMSEKRQQVRGLKAEYDVLMNRSRAVQCSCSQDYWGNLYQCGRCDLYWRAQRLSACVYEKPLPEQKIDQMVVMFELRAPLEIKLYRDVLACVAVLVSQPERSEAILQSTWQEHADLQQYRTRTESFDFNLRSPTKSFIRSHYASLEISRMTSPDDYIRPSGANLCYGEVVADTIAVGRDVKLKTIEACVLKVSHPRLQRYVTSTNHTDSDVLANQEDCPSTFLIGEFKAFGCLRAGLRLQLMNICRAFVLRSLPFGNTDVFALIAQAMWEAEEPGSDFRRVAFQEFFNEQFVQEFMKQAILFLSTHENNWEQVGTLRVAATIATRVFVLTNPDTTAHGSARELIFLSREIGMKWMQMAIGRYVKTMMGEADVETLRKHKDVIVEIAAVTTTTYLVDGKFVGELVRSSEDVCDWIIIMNAIQNHRSMAAMMDNKMRRVLMCSINLWDNRFGVGFDSALLQEGCTMAIQKIWNGCSDGTLSGRWMPYCRGWLWATFTDTGGVSRIWMNLMTGEFRVNGMTIGTLPASITSHRDFMRTFGSKIVVDAQPTTVKNEYVASNWIAGLKFRFRTGPNGSLRISYKTRDGSNYLLVPVMYFERKFPAHFSAFSHWQSGAEVQFRPPLVVSEAFRWNSYEFVLNLTTGVLYDQVRSAALVNFHSTTAEGIYASGVSRMDDASHCHIWALKGSFEIDLHRLGMVFEPSLMAGKTVLLWKQNSDYYIARSQDLGCLIGLGFGLVLETSEDATAYKKLVLPNFPLRASLQRDGVFKYATVEADFGRSATEGCRYFEFDVTDETQELKAQTHESWLMLALLHVLTSSVVTDPFTKRTGLEMAMAILRSARCFVNAPLSEHAVSLLHQIAGLAPLRLFYPAYLKSMEVTAWSDQCLDYAASDDLVFLVRRILDHSNRFRDYFKAHRKTIEIASIDALLARGHFRSTQFYSSETTLRRDEEIELTLDVPKLCPFAMRSTLGTAAYMRELAVCSFLMDGNSSVKPLDHHEFIFTKDVILTGGRISTDETQVWWEHPETLKDPSMWLMWMEWAVRLTKDDSAELALALSWLVFTGGNGENDRFATDLYRVVRLKDEIKSAGFADLPRPPYNTKHHYQFNELSLQDVIERYLVDIGTFMQSVPFHQWNNQIEMEMQYSRKTQSLVKNLIRSAQRQWPAGDICVPFHSPLLSDAMGLQTELSELWSDWKRNLQLHDFLLALDKMIQRFDGRRRSLPELVYPSQWPSVEDKTGTSISVFPANWSSIVSSPISREPVLSISQAITWESMPIVELNKTFCDLKEKYEGCIQDMTAVPRSSAHVVVQLADAALVHSTPSRCALFCLLLTNEPSVVHLRDAILQAGDICTGMQWIKRLVLLRSKRKHYELRFRAELQNTPHANWNPKDNPEWLLLEIECDFAIRSTQVKVVQHLLQNPKSVATQLNMGEGKTHVIVPMLLATLSDKSQLASLTVLHQLLATNYSALVQKLGGLVGKRVYHLPYARDLKVSPDQVQRDMQLAMRGGDVLITCPDYRLSAYLKSLEFPDKGLAFVRWTEAHLRHVVDESDEAFRVNFQLVYAIGAQQPLDANSLRWKAAGAIFESVKNHCSAIHKQFRDETELSYDDYEDDPTRFPLHFRVIGRQAYEKLKALVVGDILEGRSGELGLQLLTTDKKMVARNFLLDESLSTADLDKHILAKDDLTKACLLLRGLLTFEVLYFTLLKRYRVEYGVRPKGHGRDGMGTLAVPFRAKDVPSERADFGHPDVAICLTLLSYYYSGLNERQMHKLLSDLKNSVSGEVELRGWLVGVEDAPTDLTSVNLVDVVDLRTRVYPAIQNNQRAITYFLSTYVFPREAKQFPMRLSASAWDLAQSEQHVLGFSGTNDTSELLPLQLVQDDLAELCGTNELVNSYLHREENNVYRHLQPNASTENVLDMIGTYDDHQEDPDHPVRVLLDVGALLLDKTNAEVSAAWLERSPHTILGAVYFEGNQIVVLDRRGCVTPFGLSGLRHSLNNCVVYLDDSHTRGTDLPIPACVRACVTVGSSLTRDRLAQGCMRMRLLENGHRLMFVASHTVHLELQQFSKPASVSSEKIVEWCKGNSSNFITNQLTMWSANGVEFYRKRELLQGELGANFCADENLSLASMYGMKRKKQPLASIVESQTASLRDGIDAHAGLLQDIVNRVRRLAGGSYKYGQVLGEEQERQLEPEQEDQRQRQFPPRMKPYHGPVIHPFVARLAKTGKWPPRTASEKDAVALFPEVFAATSITNELFVTDWVNKKFYVTKEFTRTVILPQGSVMDDYLRTPSWIIWLDKYDTILVVSPFEVNELWDAFKQNARLTLIPVAVRLRPGQTMMFDSPGFDVGCEHPLPASSSDAFFQLLMATGTLYLQNQQEVDAYIAFLGLCPQPRSEDQTRHFDAQRIAMSGFVAPEHRAVVGKALAERCSFTNDPTRLVREICRLNGTVHLMPHSHVGELLDKVKRPLVAVTVAEGPEKPRRYSRLAAFSIFAP